MYTREFWDNIYANHYHDAPWMDDSWKSSIVNIISSDMDPLVENRDSNQLRLLDYGCGNGHLGKHFADYGMKVDLADISSVLVKHLHNEYDNLPNINIYNVSHPGLITGELRYDFIIAWNVFHHIEPPLWQGFLDEFAVMMNQNAHLFISGWDYEDPIIQKDNHCARYTERPTWCINELARYVNKDDFCIVKNEKIKAFVPEFECHRIYRYYLLMKL